MELPSYNLLRYEYDTIRMYDYYPSGVSYTLGDYYRRAMKKYVPLHTENIFKWFKQYSEDQLASIGLMIRIHDMTAVLKIETLETIWKTVIISHQVVIFNGAQVEVRFQSMDIPRRPV